MAIYEISGFDRAPHWDTALIEADSESDARSIFREQIAEGNAARPSEVWNVQPEEAWIVRPAPSPLLFILGGGCRG